MKKILLFGFIAVLGLSACHKKNNDGIIGNGYVDPNATYKVTNFVNNGVQNSALYSNYIFKFGTNGVIEASNSGITNLGNWQINSDTFRITNFAIAPLSSLNNFWTTKQIDISGINVYDSSIANITNLFFAKQ